MVDHADERKLDKQRCKLIIRHEKTANNLRDNNNTVL